MEPRGALWRADAALDALVSAEPLPPRAAPASGSATPPPPPPLPAATATGAASRSTPSPRGPAEAGADRGGGGDDGVAATDADGGGRRKGGRSSGCRSRGGDEALAVSGAPPPLDTAPCAPGERAGSIRAWWREREQMLAPDRSVTLMFPSGQGFVVSRLQIVAPDCSVTLIFPSGQPVVPRGRLGPRAAAPASGAPATATESSSVAARDRRRRAHGRIDAASRGSLPSRAAPNHSCTTRRQAMRLCLRCELCRAAVEQSRPAPHQGG